MKRGDRFQHAETEEIIVFHHHRPLSWWTSFRDEMNMTVRIHLPTDTAVLTLTEWEPID